MCCVGQLVLVSSSKLIIPRANSQASGPTAKLTSFRSQSQCQPKSRRTRCSATSASHPKLPALKPGPGGRQRPHRHQPEPSGPARPPRPPRSSRSSRASSRLPSPWTRTPSSPTETWSGPSSRATPGGCLTVFSRALARRRAWSQRYQVVWWL